MQIQKINQQNRDTVNKFIKNHWFSLNMIVHGEIIDITKTDGYFILENKNIIALITYRSKLDKNLNQRILEILSLDSLRESQGLGSLLLNKIVSEAKQNNYKKIILTTTNDNTKALRFYQKRGFDIKNFYYNALDISRKIKPQIPVSGIDNISLKHEFELEMILD